MLRHCPNLVAIGCKEPIIPAGYRFVRPDRNGLKRSYKTLKEKWRGKFKRVSRSYKNLRKRYHVNKRRSATSKASVKGHPQFNGEPSNSQNSVALFTVNKTSFKRAPLLRRGGHRSEFAIGYFYCISPLLSGQLI